jgi:hypothetical protein
LPKLYTVAATMIATAPSEFASSSNPATATSAEIASSPSGENLCTSGPANNRSTSTIAIAYTSTHPAFTPRSVIAGDRIDVIQLSVPSSVTASGIITSAMTMKIALPAERDHRP